MGIILVLYIFINLAFFAPRGEEEFPVGEQAEAADRTPMVLENWKIWLTILAALILVAYSAPFIDMIQNAPPASKGYRM
ncbi:hypothetical protein R0J90_18725, partial [Micrococcus sp. SIMBA_144]